MKRILEYVPIGVMVVDAEGVIRQANPAAIEIFGYQDHDLVGRAVDLLVPESVRDSHEAHRAGYAARPVPRPMGSSRVLQGLRRDGATVAVELGLFPAPTGSDIFVTVLDVSAREEVRRELQEAQQINKAGTWSFDVATERVVWSPELFRIFRLPPAPTAPPAETQIRLISPASRARLEPAFVRAATEGVPYELELELTIRDAEGPLIAVARCEPQIDADGRVTRLVGTFQDVTDLARAQRQRDRLLQRLSLARTAAKVAIWEWDVDADVLVWDDAMYALYGKAPGTPVAYDDWRGAVHPADGPAVDRGVQAALAEDGSFQFEFRIRTGDDERHVLVAAAVHRDPITRARRMVGINIDITESARFQRALRERTEQWDRFFEVTSNMLWNWDFATGEVERNVAFEKALGYSADEMTSAVEWWVDRVHPEDRARVLQTFDAALKGGAQTTGYEYRLRRRDGSYVTLRDRVVIMRDADGRAYRALGAMTDITEALRQEELSRRANNLESLGLLAGGIAHDYNNQLTGILALAELLHLEADDPREVRDIARQIGEAVGDAAQLTRQLLTFSKGGAPSRRTVALDTLVRKQVRFALTGSSTRVDFDFPDGLWLASIDPAQIAQVIQNLVLNADQAMGRGGVLRVSGRNRPDADPDRRGMIELRVEDDGPGMPEAVLRRIFDPYFTTKSTGHGLGLAICHSIVERHQGSIRAESSVGEGSAFILRLPAAAPATPAQPPAVRLEQGAARVLVVDDLPDVGRLLARLLRSLGYRADATQSVDGAAVAIEQALSSGEGYAVVITDLTIPGSEGGTAVLRRARRIDPGLPVIVASGYANDPILADHAAHGFDGKLAKPIQLAALSREVAAVLGRRR